MGIFKRKNDTAKAMNAAEQAMPGAYQSRYKDRINAALDALGGSGTDSAVDDLTAQAFDQYRQRAGQNASAAAQNAVDVTNGLSGGYGSSWAGNVAQQGYNEQMAAVDDALPSLRAKAASRVQDQQNSLTDLLNAMMTQENIDQSEHSGSVADAQNWRDYTASRADTARQEVSNFWNNAWQSVVNGVSAMKTAYDTYNGFAQQKEQTLMQKIQLAANLQASGETELAKAMLEGTGIDPAVLDSYTGDKPTWKDQLEWLPTGSSLMASGDEAAAKSGLTILGMPVESLTSYSDLTSQALDSYVQQAQLEDDRDFNLWKRKQDYAQMLASGSSGGGSRYSRSSGSTGSSGSSGSGTNLYTTSGSGMTLDDALKIAKQMDSLDEKDPQRSWYQNLLNEGGFGTPSATTSDVLNRVMGYVQKGYNASAISVKLQHEGYSNDEIANIFNRLGIGK